MAIATGHTNAMCTMPRKADIDVQAFGWDGCERMSAFRAMSRMGSGRDA